MSKNKDPKKKKNKKTKKVTEEGKFDHPLYGWATPVIEYDLPVFKAPRGPIKFNVSPSFNPTRGGDYMNISRFVSVGSLVGLVVAALGHTLFGYSGLELVAGSLALHYGADLIEDVLS